MYEHSIKTWDNATHGQTVCTRPSSFVWEGPGYCAMHNVHVHSYIYMYVERTDITCTCTWSKDPLLIGDKTHASNCFDTNQLIVSLRPSSVAMYKNQTQQSVFLYH